MQPHRYNSKANNDDYKTLSLFSTKLWWTPIVNWKNPVRNCALCLQVVCRYQFIIFSLQQITSYQVQNKENPVAEETRKFPVNGLTIWLETSVRTEDIVWRRRKSGLFGQPCPDVGSFQQYILHRFGREAGRIGVKARCVHPCRRSRARSVLSGFRFERSRTMEQLALFLSRSSSQGKEENERRLALSPSENKETIRRRDVFQSPCQSLASIGSFPAKVRHHSLSFSSAYSAANITSRTRWKGSSLLSNGSPCAPYCCSSSSTSRLSRRPVWKVRVPSS